jgi:hypothetical protein
LFVFLFFFGYFWFRVLSLRREFFGGREGFVIAEAFMPVLVELIEVE